MDAAVGCHTRRWQHGRAGGGVVRQAQAAHGAVQRGQAAVVLAAPAHPAPIPLGSLDMVQTSFILGPIGADNRAAGMGAA